MSDFDHDVSGSLLEVLGLLLDKTEAGNLSWRAGSRDNSFVVGLGSQLVMISYIPGSTCYRFRVLDNGAREILAIDSEPATTAGLKSVDFKLRHSMHKLHAAAEASIADTGLAALITELQKV